MSTKKFLIPRQITTWYEYWKQVCPNCKSIEELHIETDYDTVFEDQKHTVEKVYGFNRMAPMRKEYFNICSNCGYVFSIDE